MRFEILSRNCVKLKFLRLRERVGFLEDNLYKVPNILYGFLHRVKNVGELIVRLLIKGFYEKW